MPDAKELVVFVDSLEEATLQHLQDVTLPTFGCQLALLVCDFGQPQPASRMHLGAMYLIPDIRSMLSHRHVSKSALNMDYVTGCATSMETF